MDFKKIKGAECRKRKGKKAEETPEGNWTKDLFGDRDGLVHGSNTHLRMSTAVKH